MKDIRQIIDKTCSCGKHYSELPKNHKTQITGELTDGAWFDCQCKSTCFVPLDKIKIVISEIKNA